MLAIRALIGAAIGAAVARVALPLAGALPGSQARQPYDLRAVIARAGEAPDVVLEATYGWVRRDGA